MRKQAHCSPDSSSCTSYHQAMRLTRRGFVGGLGALSLPLWLPRAVFSVEPSDRDVLVCIFLRGGTDGLNLVVPFGDSHYYQHRSSIAIAAPGGGGNAAIALDGFFGFHPAAAPLAELYQAGHLAIVHATGIPQNSHSHFDAMSFLERCDPGSFTLTNGWISRHLTTAAGVNDSAFRAVSVGSSVPASLRGGTVPATAVPSVESFAVTGDGTTSGRFETVLRGFYGDPSNLSVQARQTLTAVERLAEANLGEYEPAGGAEYPDEEIGEALKLVARLLKADLGMEVACLDYGGWDTHAAEGGATGQFANLLGPLAEALNAFYTDLEGRANHVTVVTMSEFGRRAKENGSGGTDHGEGSVCMALGGGIVGGRVYGSWPGLAPEQLSSEFGDLRTTTDVRQVLAELVERRLLNGDVAGVFPGLGAPSYLGLARPI